MSVRSMLRTTKTQTRKDENVETEQIKYLKDINKNKSGFVLLMLGKTDSQADQKKKKSTQGLKKYHMLVKVLSRKRYEHFEHEHTNNTGSKY